MSVADIMDATGVIRSSFLPQAQRTLIYSKVGATETKYTVTNVTGLVQPGLLSVEYVSGNGSVGTGTSTVYWSNTAAQDGTEVNNFTIANTTTGSGSPFGAQVLANNTICCVLPASLSSQITLVPGTGFSLNTTGAVYVYWIPLNAGAFTVA